MRLMFQGLFLAPQIVGEAIKVRADGGQSIQDWHLCSATYLHSAILQHSSTVLADCAVLQSGQSYGQYAQHYLSCIWCAWCV